VVSAVVNEENERRIASLRNEVKERSDRVGILESQVTSLGNEVTELKQQIKDKESAALTAAAAIRETQAKAGAMEGREAALAATNTSLQGQLTSVNNEIEKKLIDIRSLQRSGEEQRANITRLTAEHKTLDGAYNDVCNEVKSLKSSNTTLTGEVATLSKQVNDLKNESESLQSKLKTATSRADDIDNTSRQAKVESDRTLRAAEAEAASSHSKYMTSQGKVDQLVGDIESLNSRLKLEQAAAVRERDELTRQISSLTSGREGQRGKLLKLWSNFKSLTSVAMSLKQENLEQSQTFGREILSVRQQVVNSLQSSNNLLAETTKKYKKELAEV
jgi:chromosome segregation ATPase